MTSQDNQSQEKKRQTLKVCYEVSAATYANQFVVSRVDDDVLVGFSSGGIEDQASGGMLLPVHTRIAMSANSTRKLMNLLSRALAQDAAASQDGGQAQLPQLSDS